MTAETAEAERAPLVPLTDTELETVGLDELVVAYRALREQHGALISRALRQLQAEGKYTGGNEPFGMRVSRDGETLVPVKHEQRAIARARELRGQGMSLRGVAGTLEEEGFRSREGTRFHGSQIRRMVSEEPIRDR